MDDAGGIDLARRAFLDPALRQQVAEPLLDRLGVADLDVRAGADALVAGAELCRLCGAVAFPYPVPALLARPPSGGARFLVAVDGERGWADHGDLPGPWVAVDLGGRARSAEPVATDRNRTLGPFVERLGLAGPVDGPGTADLVVALVLDCWRILGALEAAHAMAVGHVGDRRQFGRTLAEFQGVQFHVADSVVSLRGLRQLARFTACRAAACGAGALVDALALRTYALEAARTVLSASQLLHGAVGFCDEHDLSVITRSVQAPLRLPSDLGRTTELLAGAIDRHGFDGLFDAAGEDARGGGG
jgi:hypothetical protein